MKASLPKLLNLDPFDRTVALDDLVTRQRFRLFKKATLITILVFVVFAIQIWVVAPRHLLLITTMVALFVAAVINYFSLNKHRSLKRSSVSLLTIWCILIHIDTYYSGGIRNSANFYFAVFILSAYMLLGKRAGKLMAGFAILHLVYFYIITTQTNWVNYDLVGNDPWLVNLYFFLSTATGVFALTFQSLYIEANKKEVVNNIEAARSELERSSEDLEEKNKELERKNIDLEEFAYLASHDLQEPLKTSSGLAQLLKRQYQGKLDDKADQYLSFIVDSAVRMKKLIQDLLDYSRIGYQGKVAFIDCNELIQELLSDLNQLITETNASVNQQRLPVIKGYATEIKLLFLNLIVNAIKFRKHGETPVVNITGLEKGNCWEFAVSDNGIGIKKENFEKIFLIFQRLQGGPDSRGSGIGLAHCKKIVDLHQGNIWVESTPGQGTTFHFTIHDVS